MSRKRKDNSDTPLPKHKAFEFPQHILRQIQESSGNGFCLFVTSVDGQPEVYYQFDNEISKLGLQTFMQNWANSMQMMDNEDLHMSIQMQQNPDAFRENDDEDDEE